MILITGANGNFGKATIDFLLEKGTPATDISALVRDDSKAEDLKAKGVHIKIGDYDNYASLVSAFTGVDQLLLISGSDVSNRDQQHENAVKAAKEAGVKHILYTSFERKNETENSPINFIATSHIYTENLIKSSGMTYTIFRNNLYMDILPMFFGENVTETGIYLPAGETKAAFTLRSDMAEAAANVLRTEGHHNKEYEFSNTENVSLPEVAELLGEVVDKNISYVSPSKEVFVDTLSKAGVPMEYVGMFAGIAEAVKQGEFETAETDLEKLLGRTPTSVKTFLTNVYSA